MKTASTDFPARLTLVLALSAGGVFSQHRSDTQQTSNLASSTWDP
jgi:hypothetical protein